MLGYVGHNELRLTPVARFPNGPLALGGELHWNVSGLFENVLTGPDLSHTTGLHIPVDAGVAAAFLR